MQIQEANTSDIPEIIKVLKASLGEDDLPLSQDIWEYKHIINPFGKSIVLIAKEDEQIIGVRAFMRWEWQIKTKVYRALRAVDTATHPDHQGKGVFKKLTLKAVEVAKASGDHLIFNTPNNNSMPGYLKMGWNEVGKIHVGVRPSHGFLNLGRWVKTDDLSELKKDSEIFDLCKKWNENLVLKKGIFTPKTPEFLTWRYEKNPLQKYSVYTGNGFYLAVYTKKRNLLRELRISECLIDKNKLSSDDLRSVIKKAECDLRAHLVTFSPRLLNLNSFKGSFGPMLTLNALNLYPDERISFLKIDNWFNSIGDLELF